MQRVLIPVAHVGSHFPEERDERRFKAAGLLEPLKRRTLHAGMDKGGQCGVVAGDAEPFELVQGAIDPFGA